MMNLPTMRILHEREQPVYLLSSSICSSLKRLCHSWNTRIFEAILYSLSSLAKKNDGKVMIQREMQIDRVRTS